MWLLSRISPFGEEHERQVLFSDPKDIVDYIQTFRSETLQIEWINVFEPPKESENTEVVIRRAAQTVPLSRTKEEDE